MRHRDVRLDSVGGRLLGIGALFGSWSPRAMDADGELTMTGSLRSFNANGNSETWKLCFDSLDSVEGTEFPTTCLRKRSVYM